MNDVGWYFVTQYLFSIFLASLFPAKLTNLIARVVKRDVERLCPINSSTQKDQLPAPITTSLTVAVRETECAEEQWSPRNDAGG